MTVSEIEGKYMNNSQERPNINVIVSNSDSMATPNNEQEKLIETELSYQLTKPIESMHHQGEVFDFLEREPEVGALFGFHLTKTSEYNLLEAPRVETLNEMRSSLPATLGLNTGKFIEIDQGSITAETFVNCIANREIPVSHGSSPYFTEHDITKHMLGYATMHESAFESFVQLAQKAVASGNEAMVQQASHMFDMVSSLFTAGQTDTSEIQAHLSASKFKAAFRSRRISNRQEQLHKDLEQLAKS